MITREREVQILALRGPDFHSFSPKEARRLADALPAAIEWAALGESRIIFRDLLTASTNIRTIND